MTATLVVMVVSLMGISAAVPASMIEGACLDFDQQTIEIWGNSSGSGVITVANGERGLVSQNVTFGNFDVVISTASIPVGLTDINLSVNGTETDSWNGMYGIPLILSGEDAKYFGMTRNLTTGGWNYVKYVPSEFCGCGGTEAATSNSVTVKVTGMKVIVSEIKVYVDGVLQ